MVKRKKIGLLFTIDDSWTGGLYYLFNIIKALQYLPNVERPHITVFYRNESVIDQVKNLNYPHVSFLPILRKISLASRIVSKLRRILGYKIIRKYPQYNERIVDFVFPCMAVSYGYPDSLGKLRKVFWIPDFQHKYLTHFFSTDELKNRDALYNGIGAIEAKLVVSSNDAKKDFETFYPNSKNKVEVVRFASVLSHFNHLSKEDVFKKYNIKQPYFISPNQFWAHKNHLIVLKAIKLLKEKNLEYKIFFTGKESDYRNPGYIDKLKEFVNQHEIDKYVGFLGFIDRAEQLLLINHAHAVIQPSLFEGWSTVVEDAKAMNQIIIASGLNVHHEQCGDNAIYFNPEVAEELAKIIQETLLNRPKPPDFSYHNAIKKYAEQILNL